MELASFSHALAGVLYTGLLVALWTRGRSPVLADRALVAAVALSAAWAWCALAALGLRMPALALGAAALDLARYAAWFWWLTGLLRRAAAATEPGRGSALALVAALLVAAALALPAAALFGGPAVAATGVRLGAVAALALPVLGLVLVEQLYRNATEEARWAIKPTGLALGLMFAFDTYFYSQASLFGRIDGDAMSIRAAVHAVGVPLLLLGHARQARPDGRFRISRSAAFHTAALVLVGAYLLFIAAVGYYVRGSGGDWGSALQVGLLFIGSVLLVALLLSESMRAKLRVFVGKNFFSYRYDYRAEWLRFTSMLSASAAPQQVGELVVRGLADMVESPGGALWTRALDGEHYVQAAAWSMPPQPAVEPASAPLPRFLRQKDWIVDLAEHRLHPHRYDGITMPDWLRSAAGAWLVIPLRVVDTLVGFVVLVQPRTPVPINWEVRDLLKTASRQAAGFLAQMQATEALLESRKFEAFNRMSAFVVHDLKNIVTQLSLMMKNARRLQDNPEFQADMLETVDHAVDKMRQLMVQLREGEKPADGTAGVALAPVARRLAQAATARGRTLELQLEAEPFTRGSPERIERVLGHLVANALDATPADKRVWLRLARDAGRALVEVGDEGCGMTPEFVQQRLFRPFASTKTAGMGIGAYESFQVLRELGGSIDVDSAVGRGTVISIALPLFDATQRSDFEAAVAR